MSKTGAKLNKLARRYSKQMDLDIEPISIDELKLAFLQPKNLSASVLRLDKIHSEISGNKWFKLKEYLSEAIRNQQQTVLTFGGAYSNHILATAAACKAKALHAVGIIRGEQASVLSPTLVQAKQMGMELYFVSREAYREKELPAKLLDKYRNALVINEGGYGIPGMKGAKAILSQETEAYTHVLAAVGTGTTLAGLVEAAAPGQQIIGISVLKNNFSLHQEINQLLSLPNQNRFELMHQYSFGGYAKQNKELLGFMNEWYRATGVPTDFVYTGKAFYAFKDLVETGFFPAGSRVLLVHSGGLQGNRSLPNGTLIF